LTWNGIRTPLRDGSKVLECGLSIGYGIEMKEITKTPQYS
jgi:hypothetical protein